MPDDFLHVSPNRLVTTINDMQRAIMLLFNGLISLCIMKQSWPAM